MNLLNPFYKYKNPKLYSINDILDILNQCIGFELLNEADDNLGTLLSIDTQVITFNNYYCTYINFITTKTSFTRRLLSENQYSPKFPVNRFLNELYIQYDPENDHTISFKIKN